VAHPQKNPQRRNFEHRHGLACCGIASGHPQRPPVHPPHRRRHTATGFPAKRVVADLRRSIRNAPGPRRHWVSVERCAVAANFGGAGGAVCRDSCHSAPDPAITPACALTASARATSGRSQASTTSVSASLNRNNCGRCLSIIRATRKAPDRVASVLRGDQGIGQQSRQQQ
jgi:hypothetical protein